ncbi:MAG: DUF3883 domain-containing protein [Gammaproteobacteria bacterium]|nr:DUF3883 domain-containing protein [Gammaproteobacteria bacterium]
MTPQPQRAEQHGHRPTRLPAEDLTKQARDVLNHAFDAHRNQLKVYESLRNLNEVVGTEYGDRVLYELIQNAHDAHWADDRGRITVRLDVRSETDATLYVANGGHGFRSKDVNAIKNLATTAKEVGEGIGNKGLGFRSIEALTDDVRIFSRRGRDDLGRFDGYCFRFAAEDEIEDLLRKGGVDAATARDVAETVPRYLVPLPLTEQPDEVAAYARRGYPTVIVAPLRTAEAVELAKDQIQTLADPDVPLLLFLDRIAEFRIEVAMPDQPVKRQRLTRRQTDIGDVPSLAGCRLFEVRVGRDRRFLIVQHEVDRARVLAAVERSVPRAPRIKRWLDWKGQATVSIAVGLSPGAITAGRFYNFLPMGEAAEAPLLGHLDAPFFAAIDRRNADFDLPLNAVLIEAAAEACAHAALHIVGQADTPIPQRTVFDLVAWTDDHAEVLDSAFEDVETSLEDAPVVPTIPVDDVRWSSLTEAWAWPAESYSLMKAAQVAKRAKARLVSTDIKGDRLQRLEAMAERNYVDLSPSGKRLAQWSARFAQSLADRKVAARTWSWFYEDLHRVFGAAGEKLDALAGKEIMLDRSKKLRRAGKGDAASGGGVFVRMESSRRRRAKDSVPLPPPRLTRRYRFLDEKITLRRETLNAFVKAGLVREFDPAEALAGLRSVLGAKANANRRQEALMWAFQVWRMSGAGIQEALLSAGLWVPTVSGWQPATQSAFSSSWTPTGRILENFLVEAAGTSADCRQARDRLLVNFADWPVAPGETRRQWTEFLTLLGVVDGLRPVAAPLRRHGQGGVWASELRRGNPKEGLDQDWCYEASDKSFRNPNTDYQRRGEAWRLPGQIEHGELPHTAKEGFQELAFRHLDEHQGKFLTFQIGRFERYQIHWNLQELPTPLATFLRSKAWIASSTNEEQEPGFCRPSECWAARTRQNRPPRFMRRVNDLVAGLLEGNRGLANLAFGDTLKLRDWHSKDTATARLQELATVSPTLATSDRRDFRNEYRRAWLEVSETDVALPSGLDLAVNRHGVLELLRGDLDTNPTVIVTQNAQVAEARILSAAGHALLDIGTAPIERIAEKLEAAGGFTPRRLDGADVRFLVDGEPFVPRASDPLLTSLGLEWLPEVVVLGHELLAKELERGIRRATIERRAQAIRVRRCKTVALVVDGTDPATHNSIAPYGIPHPELPTLILPDRIALAWATLGWDLSVPVSQLIHPQIRFLEPLLLRLARHKDADALDPPSDQALAEALRCDTQTLQELRAAMRTDLGHILHLLMPVVAYFADVVLARQLQNDAEQSRATFDVEEWLRVRLPVPEPRPKQLVKACGKVSDRATLRRELGLDYERFNLALLDLGEAPLSNEAELRSVYEAYLRQMRPGIVERLRRLHAADFREGCSLVTYVDRKKTLAFLEFDPTWVLTREALDEETVERHVARLLDDVLGEDLSAELPSLRGLIERNRKAVREFATSAMSVIGAWCRRNQAPVPGPWRNDDPLSVARHLEDAGLLDFATVRERQLPELCHRAACWPEGMPRTLDPAPLGLDRATVEEEKKRRQQELQRKIIEKRSINFAGTDLDTADPAFANTFRLLAEASIDGNDAWFERSRRQPRLAQFAGPEGGGQAGGGTGRSGTGRRRQPAEEQRQAMGFASEWLALQYLRRRHPDFVDETCWVSRNRSRLYSGDEGDDAAGYDFCVKTPRTEWLYEVKSALEDTGEFEMTPNEMRVAASTSRRGRRRYRILYVPFVFSPDRWRVLDLPNPMDDETRDRFRQIGQGSVRFRFEHSGGIHKAN